MDCGFHCDQAYEEENKASLTVSIHTIHDVVHVLYCSVDRGFSGVC